MRREKLISEVIENFKCVTQVVDTEEKKAKEIFSELQLDLVEEVWSYYDDFKEVTNEELEEMISLL